MTKEKKFQSVPVKWFIVLPLIGVIQKVLELFGWLEQGSWPNFILLLGVLALWIVVVLRETPVPFSPLVWIGSIYGLLVAIINLTFWMNFRESLGLEETGWSFEDLLTAINYFLRPGFQFIGQVLVGIFLGVLTGFIARMILKFQRNRR